MASIPENVASSIVERLVDKAIKEAYNLCCLKKIGEGFEAEKRKLVAKREDVRKDIEENENAGMEIAHEVKQWQESADALIAEDTNVKKSCFFGWCSNCIWQYQRGKELTKKTQDIKAALTEKQSDKIGRPAKLPDIEYHSSPNFMSFDSRKLVYDNLLEELKNGSSYMVALQGIGGSGKTTLAIQVGEIVKNEGYYNRAILVTVSNDQDVKKIQDEIAKPLGVKFDQEERDLDRAKKLSLRLTDGAKILIVLDDVWEKLDLENIGIPSAHNHKGCRILLTTRDLDVCRKMGCQGSTHQLGIVPEKEAWIFFQAHSGNINSSKKLKCTAEKIARKCGGLPLALAAVASTLRDQTLEDWEAALRSLENPRPVDITDHELKEVYQLLKVSYDFLKNEHAQKLFKLCSLFPEDHKIPLEDLTRFAIGLGLFGEIYSYRSARDDMHRAKKRLIESCLLMEVDEGKCVKMHDLILAVAKVIANNEIQLIVGPKWNLSDIERQMNVRYLNCQNMIDFPGQLACPELEILIVSIYTASFEKHKYPNYLDVPETFFEGMSKLKVLVLWNHYIMGKLTLKLPRSIELLESLRTLCLRDLEFEDISVLTKLQRLETL